MVWLIHRCVPEAQKNTWHIIDAQYTFDGWMSEPVNGGVNLISCGWTRFLNLNIIRNLPSWILSSVRLQVGLEELSPPMEEPLPPPGSQPHSSKCGEGDIFFTIIAENILGLVLMDSDKEVQEGGDICLLIADSRCCVTETKTTLILQLK